MVKGREIKEGVHFVGAIDWDRRLFDELIPLPDGTSYNSYLIRGSKQTALIDSVYPPRENELIEHLKELNVEKIDYIIANHAEGDHSGAIPTLLKIYKEAKVVTNQKCKEMLVNFYHIPEEKFLIITDNETISLGDKTLQFIMAPWVHWPETMFTYLKEEKILFTCDLFGSHIATSDIFPVDEPKVLESAKRYYAEIMMPFRENIKKHLQKINTLDIEIIAPSHGVVYNNPSFILNAYRDWTSDNVKNEVIIPYVSMYGSTFKMVEYLTDKLSEKGIKVKPFNIIKSDIGEFTMALVDACTCVVGSPTLLTGIHPAILLPLSLMNVLRPKLKFFSLIGSYGWGGRIEEQVKGFLTNLKAEYLGSVLVKGEPVDRDFKNLDALTDKIYEKHRELGLLDKI